MRPDVYIAVVLCSRGVEEKINSKHNVTLVEVREATVNTEVLASGWIWDEERGDRLLVVGTTYTGRELRVVLYPRDPTDGVWTLGTAMAKVGE